MVYRVKLEKFEGPLDLLLEIVEAKKFNVLQLSLSELAEQFINHLKTLSEKDMSEIARFVAVGARLALLKSRELVPSLLSEDDAEENLKKQLVLYHPYRTAAKKLEKTVKSKSRYFSREAFLGYQPIFTFPSGVTKKTLNQAMTEVLGSLQHARLIPQAKIQGTISLEECIGHLKRVMQGKEKLNFSDYLSEKRAEEHVVHFIGLLELMRSGHVVAHQKVAFGKIEVTTYAK